MLVLFLEAARALEPGRFLRVADPAGAEMKSFESLLQSGKPRCGQIRDAQRDFLFGKDCVEIGSVALTCPWDRRAPWECSRSARTTRRTFHPGMSTEFLSRIGELARVCADAMSAAKTHP